MSQYSSQLAPIAVDAVMRVVDPAKDTNVNLKDIKIVKKLGYGARHFGIYAFYTTRVLLLYSLHTWLSLLANYHCVRVLFTYFSYSTSPIYILPSPTSPPSFSPLPLSLPPLPPSLTSLVHRGTVEDTELVEGLVLDQKASHLAGGITQVEKAKIGLIQFCISPPKTDVNEQNNTCDTMLVVAFWLYFRISLLWQRFGSDDYVCVVSFRLVFAMCQVQWS